LDPEALKEYIKNNPDKTLKEIGAAFGASDASVLYKIRQLGIIYKKNHIIQGAGRRKAESIYEIHQSR
jgi:predicted aconitase